MIRTKDELLNHLLVLERIFVLSHAALQEIENNNKESGLPKGVYFNIGTERRRINLQNLCESADMNINKIFEDCKKITIKGGNWRVF